MKRPAIVGRRSGPGVELAEAARRCLAPPPNRYLWKPGRPDDFIVLDRTLGHGKLTKMPLLRAAFERSSTMPQRNGRSPLSATYGSNPGNTGPPANPSSTSRMRSMPARRGTTWRMPLRRPDRTTPYRRAPNTNLPRRMDDVVDDRLRVLRVVEHRSHLAAQ